MGKLIIECLELKNLNLSDCLNEDENVTIIKAFEVNSVVIYRKVKIDPLKG